MFQYQKSKLRMQVWTRLVATTICIVATLAGCAGSGMCGLRECPGDAKISGEVRALLAQSALAPPNLISVQTVHGVVYLRGMVSTPYQIAEAASIAERAAGVIDVRNQLYIDNSR